MLVWGAYDWFVNVFEIRPSLVQICFRAIWICVRWSCKFFSWHCSWQSPIRINSALDHNFTESQALPFAFIFEHVDSLCCVFVILCLLYLHWAASWTLGECGSSRLERPAVWGLSLWTLESVGVRALNSQQCGSYHIKCSKLWELSLQTTRSAGAVVLNAQKYGSSPFKRSKALDISP